MKITFVVPFVNLTGGIRLVLGYANWLHDAGHHVTVVYPLWPYQFHFTPQQQVTEFRLERRRPPGVRWFHLKCRLLRVPWISTMFLPRGDVVVATAWPTAHDVARLHASRGRKVHFVMHHETGTGPEERIRAIYRLPLYRITISEAARRSLEELGADVRDVVPAGVDTDLFFPDGQPMENTVLMLYHPDPRKGAPDGVRALTLLRERMPELRPHVCGTVRPAPEELPAWMPFEFHPEDASLRRLYSTAAALLYPSRLEGFGLPPLEAMACGCPVVATNVGAVPDFSEHGRNALVAPVGDAGVMAGHLETLLRDQALRRRLAAEGRRTATHYSVRQVAPLFYAALARATERPSL